MSEWTTPGKPLELKATRRAVADLDVQHGLVEVTVDGHSFALTDSQGTPMQRFRLWQQQALQHGWCLLGARWDATGRGKSVAWSVPFEDSATGWTVVPPDDAAQRWQYLTDAGLHDCMIGDHVPDWWTDD